MAKKKKSDTPADAEETAGPATATAEKKSKKAAPDAAEAKHEHGHKHADGEEHDHDHDHEHDHEHDEAAADIKEELKKVLEVKVEDAGVLRKRLTITIPAETIKEQRDKQYSNLIKDAIIPGFRRGRAPRRLIERRFAGEVGDEVQTRLVTNGYMAATEMKELKILGDPQFWSTTDDAKEELVEVEKALKRMKLPEDGPLTYRCECEIWPQFTLPELKKIKVKRPKVKVTDKDVEKQIERLQSMRGTWEPVASGKVQKDDLLIADVTMKVGKEVIKTSENVQVFARPQRVEGVSLEKLGDAMVGAKPGDTKTVEGQIPEDFEKPEYRGKTAEFTIKIHELKRFVLPPVDKTFLEATGFESEKDLKEFMRSQMEGEMADAVKQGMRGQVSRHFVETVKMDLPEGLSRRHTDRAIIRKIVELRRNGVPQEEVNKHADDLRTMAAKQAVEDLKLHFIMDEISEKLEIQVSEEELNGQIAAIARRYNRRFDRVRDELAQGDGLTALYLQIRDEKCLDKLLEDAEIEDTDGPAESISDVTEST